MKDYFARLSSENWGVLGVLLTEESPIDLPRLAIQDREDALNFLRSYGYDLDLPEQAAQVERLRRDGLDCLQRLFLDTLEPPGLRIPETIAEAGPLELLLLASCPPDEALQRWACALLRVMHTLSHVSSELSMHYFPSIRQQILAPFEARIAERDGQLWLGEGDFCLPLVDFQIKAGKARDSALIKLLHKRENVAADLFDRIGVRFVTRDRLDALLVLHYLREKHLVAFPNVRAGRINSLLDLASLREHVGVLQARFENLEISLAEVETWLRQSADLSPRRPGGRRRHNPHSSADYRAIQFTVRQLVRLDPLVTDAVRPHAPGLSFYFPYEIQIVDQLTHQNNLRGKASHETYKRRQLETARRRVLGPLLPGTDTQVMPALPPTVAPAFLPVLPAGEIESSDGAVPA